MPHTVTVEYRSDLPAGVPAVWDSEPGPRILYVRDDLPDDLVRHFAQMCSVSPARVA